MEFGLVRFSVPINLLQVIELRPNSITLSGSKLVQSWSQTCSELRFGLSSSLLAAN